MATRWGIEGQVRTGLSQIIEVIEFEYDEEIEPVDDTALGDTAETHIIGSGRSRWSATVKCHWDETDLTGQEALTIGSSHTLNLYPEGNQSGDKFRAGTATVVRRGNAVSMNGTIQQTFQFKGNGPLANSTVP